MPDFLTSFVSSVCLLIALLKQMFSEFVQRKNEEFDLSTIYIDIAFVLDCKSRFKSSRFDVVTYVSLK